MATNFEIKNVVVHAELGCQIDMERLVRELPDVDFESQTFPGAKVVIDDQLKLLVFSSGSIILKGLKTPDENEIKKVIKERIAPVFEKIGSKVADDVKITIYNMVATSKITENTLDLNKIYQNKDKIIKEFPVEEIIYEPRRFPGLRMKFQRNKEGVRITALLFQTGKVVLTGARKVEQIEEMLEKLQKIIKKYGQ